MTLKLCSSLLLLTLLTHTPTSTEHFAQTATPQNAKRTTSDAAQIARIERYCRDVDRYAERNPRMKRLFTDISSGYTREQARWRGFPSEVARNTAEDKTDGFHDKVSVWMQNGRVVVAHRMFDSPSGDWAHYVNYYFRPDGSLAKVDSRLNTFYGHMSVRRVKYYNAAGRLLRASSEYRDLTTKKKRTPGDDFDDRPAPIHKKVRQLPFYNLLARGR